ncbi:hypothetical protein [Gloeothece verrucosa]|uniref:hypothetical protein n=1 Tax=Gloeothece verrucosa TaxID=2546359 RepID=UPI00017E2E77|nr:hypothetical protein [Gloeothece verrucosa]
MQDIRLWSQALFCWVGTWEDTIDKKTCFWLRFYDQPENLRLWAEEAAQQRAERLVARLRELGEDPDSLS